jgi:putative ABC transport system substrate-binding protein
VLLFIETLSIFKEEFIMKRMVQVTGLCLTALLLMSAGGREQGGSGDTARIRIGIAKILQHEALDACEKGIVDALAARGVDAVYDYQNANGDMNTAAQIANKFRNDRVAVAVGIGTPIAVALANTIKDVPVVFSSVTDPVGANLVTTLSRGEGNVTGLSDAIPTGDHIAFFRELAGIRTLGYIYTSSEANSVSALALVEEACRTQGITLVTQAISTSAELRQAAEAIVNRVDGIYLTTDNTVFSALPALVQVFGAAKKPIFSGDVTGAMTGGCMIASGFNYYKAGLATGDIIADLLAGKKAVDIPVKILTDPSESDLLFDLDAARNCGVTIPDRYLAMADYIFENGSLRER